MRKIINNPENVVSEMMEGFVSAYSHMYYKHSEVNGIILRQRRQDKVSLVIGGGSGHEPMFSGFVGRGLADAAACGNIFASPDPKTIYETGRAVDNGKGILFVYGCYAGDNLNFDMGEEFLNARGIATAHVRVKDDVASAPPERYDDRRGIAGDVFVVKIAGAACDSGASLEEVTRITAKARDNTRSVGVATSPAQLPASEEPIFELDENEIEYGMGLHGEKGVLRPNFEPADVLTERMYEQIKNDTNLKAGAEICVLVNGLVSTTILELSIAFRKLKELLDKDGIKIHDADLNNYCTSMEMGGFSISILELDEELKQYYDMPCMSPFYAKGILSGNVEEVEEVIESNPVIKETPKKNIIRAAYQKKDRYEELNVEDCRQMLIYIAKKVLEQEPNLTRIDSEIGDGDHGVGMATGMKHVLDALDELDTDDNVYSVFETAGKAMLLSMGGASGVIFGSLYMEGAMGMPPKAILHAEDLAVMERKSLTAIQHRGKAQVGDKTMVDALAPAVVAMEETSQNGLIEMLKAAEAAAKQGVEDTKNCIARFGRAKSLGERALGYQDAGATSTWLIFQGMLEFVTGAWKE